MSLYSVSLFAFDRRCLSSGSSRAIKMIGHLWLVAEKWKSGKAIPSQLRKVVQINPLKLPLRMGVLLRFDLFTSLAIISYKFQGDSLWLH